MQSKESKKKANRKYKKSAKGKLADKKYRESKKGKESHKKAYKKYYGKNKKKLFEYSAQWKKENRPKNLLKWRAREKKALERWKLKNPEKAKLLSRKTALNWHHNHKEKALLKQKKWRKDNLELYTDINRKNAISYYHKNKEKVMNRIKNWRKINKYNPQYVVRRALRSRLSSVLKKIKQKKFLNTKALLGCDFNFFIFYMENQFKSNMNWDNYGEWHIDHIKPVSKFDLTKKNEQKKCFHFSNLQPLWSKENLKKSNK